MTEGRCATRPAAPAHGKRGVDAQRGAHADRARDLAELALQAAGPLVDALHEPGHDRLAGGAKQHAVVVERPFQVADPAGDARDRAPEGAELVLDAADQPADELGAGVVEQAGEAAELPRRCGPGARRRTTRARSAPLFTAPTMPLHAAAVSALSGSRRRPGSPSPRRPGSGRPRRRRASRPSRSAGSPSRRRLQSPRITAMTRRMTPAITLSAPRTMSLTTGHAHLHDLHDGAERRPRTMGMSRRM